MSQTKVEAPFVEGGGGTNFKNLIIHSLSIISVFKINVLIRSIFFLLIYMQPDG